MIESTVIIAGGLATRLYPVTKKIPKSMIDINDEPFISHQLKLLKKNGINEVIICAGYLGEMIKNFTGDGRKFGLNIKYSFDGEKLLGTGGAVKKAINLLPDTFFIMYGDSYLPVDFQKISDYFNKNDKNALMTVMENSDKFDMSNVIYQNNKIIKYDKKEKVPEMNYIDYGLGIFKKNIFSNIKENEVIDLANIYKNLIEKDDLLGYEIKERFYEIGSFTGIEDLKIFLRK